MDYIPETFDDDGEELEDNEDIKTVAFRLIPADPSHSNSLFCFKFLWSNI